MFVWIVLSLCIVLPLLSIVQLYFPTQSVSCQSWNHSAPTPFRHLFISCTDLLLLHFSVSSCCCSSRNILKQSFLPIQTLIDPCNLPYTNTVHQQVHAIRFFTLMTLCQLVQRVSIFKAQCSSYFCFTPYCTSTTEKLRVRLSLIRSQAATNWESVERSFFRSNTAAKALHQVLSRGLVMQTSKYFFVFKWFVLRIVFELILISLVSSALLALLFCMFLYLVLLNISFSFLFAYSLCFSTLFVIYCVSFCLEIDKKFFEEIVVIVEAFPVRISLLVMLHRVLRHHIY